MNGVKGTNSMKNVIKFEKRVDSCCIADMVIDSITVYLDKAEITRSVKYEIAEGQILECAFEQLPSSIDKDSIRVEVQNNAASIMDVTYMARPTNENCDQNERLKRIRELIKIEHQSLESLEAKKLRLSRQKNVLDTFTNTLIDTSETQNNILGADSMLNQTSEIYKDKLQPQVDVYNPKHLETIHNFFQLYNDSGERFDNGLLEIEIKLQETQNKIAHLENERNEIEIRQDEQLYRELLVSLEGRINGEFELNISYVVKNCSWRPVYDVRVSNTSGVKQINYYGMVKQFSGEDWYQPTKFTLSTAEPGIGGTVPEIGLQKVQFKTSNEITTETPYPEPLPHMLSTPNLRKVSSRLSSMRKSKTPSMLGIDSSFMDTGPPSLNFVSKEIKKEPEVTTPSPNQTNKQFNFTSVSFDVVRPPMIVTCDDAEYRVMIAIINLDPHYQHVTVPRLSQFAYLRTISTNTSKYMLLAGPANIYIDSNFIGKTELKTTSPCEEFACNLGADRGIKVNYSPMLKYKENKGKTICVTFKQEIQVVNNHERPIKIIVMDQIPFSNDDKIKITLLEPVIKHPEKYDRSKPIRMTNSRLIEWDCDIGSREKKDMVLKFSVEHPVGRDIEVLQLRNC